MRTFFTSIFALSIAASFAFGQSPLNLPGDKKVTVGTEIERGYSEMVRAFSDCKEANLLTLKVCMNRVIDRNKSANTDSDGFLLGATLSEWVQFHGFLNDPINPLVTSEEEVRVVVEGQIEQFKEIRTLQKKLRIDDDMLLRAAGYTDSLKETKSLLARYESQVISSPQEIKPQPAPTDQQQFVTLTKPVLIQTPSGSVTLQPGSKLPVLSITPDNVWCHYGNADYGIPVDATDFAHHAK